MTFDVGGTLIEPHPSVGEVYARVARHFGIAAEPRMLTRCFVEAWKAKADFDYSHRAWSELVGASFRDFGAVSEECFRAIYDEFAKTSAWRIFPDVLPTLEGLRTAGVRLGIISNWDERLRPLLHALKMADYFEQMIISHEVGYPKPKSRIFLTAADAFQLRAFEILHIGDGPREDSQGAREAGFKALLVNRSQPGAEEGDIRNLTELLAQSSTSSSGH